MGGVTRGWAVFFVVAFALVGAWIVVGIQRAGANDASNLPAVTHVACYQKSDAGVPTGPVLMSFDIHGRNFDLAQRESGVFYDWRRDNPGVVCTFTHDY